MLILKSFFFFVSIQFLASYIVHKQFMKRDDVQFSYRIIHTLEFVLHDKALVETLSFFLQ